MDIKLAKTNSRKQIGGNLLTSIMGLARTFAPTIAKTLGLSALAGATSTGASQLVKKISGGYMIKPENLLQLVNYKHMLTPQLKRDLLDSIQNSSDLIIKPTQTQIGKGIGSILASIGIPRVLDMIKGRGAPQFGKPRPNLPNKTRGD